MISDEERKERERLRKEAEDERTRTLQRFEAAVIVFWGDVGFDMSDPQTKLICKTPPQTAEWTSPIQKTIHTVELYWRTKDGNYFRLSYDEYDTMPFHLDISEAHRLMNTKTNWQWFLTDAQKKELQAEDFELAKARAERNPMPGPTKDGG